MSGLIVSGGDPIMHLGLLAGILFIPMDQHCMGIPYGNSIKFLTFSHALNAFRFVWSTVMIWLIPLFPGSTFNLYFIERVIDFLGIVAQILSMIYAQDVYFFNEPYMDRP